MDFIVSRVCMAVSALVVLGILAGLFVPGPASEPVEDLEAILEDLSRTVGLLAAHEAQGELLWAVPSLPSGESIRLEVLGCSAIAQSSHRTACAQLQVPLRTWLWSGQALNESELAHLDEAAEPLSAPSGTTLRMTMSTVQVAGVERVAVFVSVAC